MGKTLVNRTCPERMAQEWEAHRRFAAAGLPGCLHSPPCDAADVVDQDTLAALRERWPPELDDDYLTAPAIGWFRDT